MKIRLKVKEIYVLGRDFVYLKVHKNSKKSVKSQSQARVASQRVDDNRRSTRGVTERGEKKVVRDLFGYDDRERNLH